MNNPIIEKTIEINASVQKVWRVFTDPAITRQMGGEYVSEWKVGSSIGWKGQDGNFYTNGTILAIQPEKLIQHELLDLKDNTRLLSVITYEFNERGERTVLTAREELSYKMSADQLDDTSAGWDFALRMVRETAEKI
jgi:uncharacterized protein YndB with AHSA1/START domain